MKRSRSDADGEVEPTLGEARDSALRLLARREHSALELRRKLKGRGFPAEMIDELLDELSAANLLSEERFTEAFINGRLGRGSGPRRIQAELHERGVTDQLVSDLLDAKEGQWNEMAREVRRKRFGDELPREYAERARQMRFLQYRGFTAEQIRAAFDDDPGEVPGDDE